MSNMATTTTSNAEAALNRLAIGYRKYNLKDGNLYFCFQADGTTFDLFVGMGGRIKMWSFIKTVSELTSGIHIGCRKAKQYNAVIGVETTRDGDLNFYAEQKVNEAVKEQTRQIYIMIRAYSKTLSSLKLQ